MKIKKTLWIILFCGMFFMMPTKVLAQEVIVSEEPKQCFDNNDELVSWIRAQMVARIETIEFQFVTMTDHDILWSTIFDDVFSHTGIPYEGDYLFWQTRGWQLESTVMDTDEQRIYNVKCTIPYYTTAEQEEFVNQEVERILRELSLENKSNYEKLKEIYKYICLNVAYDYENMYDTTSNLHHSAYAALKDGKCVCDGYALLLYRMLLEIGIDCRVITGVAGNFMEMFENYEYHAWNIVELDELYYNVDVTWDAGSSIYNWFLLSDETFNDGITNGHKREEAFTTEKFYSEYPIAEHDNPYAELMSGICGDEGDNLKWTLQNGILYIDGSGNMQDYWIDAPWYECRYNIKKVVVEDGVTSIGTTAFYDLSNLQDVKLPNSLRVIGMMAFCNCKSVTYIDIPDSVSSIGSDVFGCCYSLKMVELPCGIVDIPDFAFSGCNNLSEISFPSTLVNIGEYAFSSCQSIESIIFPEQLQYIGEQAFSGTSIAEINITTNVKKIGGGAFSGANTMNIVVDKDNQYFSDINGVLFNKDLTTLISYPAGREDSSYSIPKGTICIDNNAFNHSWNLLEISFPDGLESIGECAFASCRIQNYDFPSSLKSIGDEAFLNNTGFKSLILPANVDYGVRVFNGCNFEELIISEGVLEITSGMFGATDITNLTIPKSVQTIGADAFLLCDKLEKVHISDSVESIGNYAFWLCNNLKEVVVGNGIRQIGQGAFRECNKLSDIYYTGTESLWRYVEIEVENECLNQANIHFQEAVEHEHIRWIEYVVKAPTCSEIGESVSICRVCGEVLDTYELSKLPHTEEIDESVNATCISGGLTEGKHCSVCEEVLVERNHTAALGHSYSYKVTQEPTTSATGTLTGTCSKCGGTTTVTLPKLTTADYDYTIQKAASCTASGTGRYTWKTTTYGSFYFDVTLPATGHSYSYKVTKEPTTSATGTLTGTCSKCDGTTTVTLPKLTTADYNYTIQNESGCTTSGVGRYTLKSATYGSFYFDVTLPATGHSYSYKVTKEPTTSATGTLTGTCSICNGTTTVTLLKLTTADYDYTIQKAASCTTSGIGRYTWKTTTYGSFYFDVAIPVTGHSYGYKVTKEPTTSETGTLTGTCSKCGGTTSVTLPKLNTEDYNYTIQNESGCTTSGVGRYTWKTTTYGSFYFDVAIPATGHNYSNGSCTHCGMSDPNYVISHPVIGIIIDETLSLTLGETATLIATITPENATNKELMWSSSDTNIAIVSENGLVIAIGTGTTTITVTAADGSGVSASCEVIITTPIILEDVVAGSYYEQPVQWAVEKGITNGYGSDTIFNPEGTCSRGQIVTFLWRANGSPEPASLDNPFTDVPSSEYYYKAVLWAVENGITAGYGSDTIFNPDGACTRAQVVTFMWRAAGKPDMSNAENPFTDLEEGSFYYDAVLWAVENGITNGYGSAETFCPEITCTRGQIVTFLYRGMK